MTRRRVMSGAALLVAALGCRGGVATSGPNKVEIPVDDGTRGLRTAAAVASRQNTPASGVTKESPFPRVARLTLANGLNVAIVTSRALPIADASTPRPRGALGCSRKAHR